MAITLLCDSVRKAGTIGKGGLGVGFTFDPQANQVVVTAVMTASGQLKLISWRLAENGLSISRLNDSGSQGAAADLVDVAIGAFNFCVTATRGSDGKLHIVAWKLNPSTGQISKTSEAGGSEGAVNEIAMAQSPLGDGRVIIAVSDGAGNLVLKNWEVDQFGALHIRGDTAIQGNGAGKATNLTIRSLSNDRVLTAVRTGSGNLKLIVWRIHQDGKIERLGDSGSQGEAVSVISLTTIPEDDRVVTAVRDSGNNLRLVSWHVSSNGMTVTRDADSGNAAGGADRIATIFHDMSGPTPEFPLDPGDPILLTVVRTKRSTLKLIRWRLKANVVQRLTGDFGDNTGVIDRIAHLVKLDNNVYLVSIRDGDGRLRLVTYKLDDPHQPALNPDALLLYDKTMFENTVRVVPPIRGKCVHGSIVLHLGQPRNTAGLAYRDLLDGNGKFPISAPSTRVAYPFDSQQSNGTDNQIIRLDDGTLLALKNGYTWSAVTPKPAWFDTVTMASSMSPHGRNALFILRSSDCGHSWTIASVIDAAVIASGKYGWPQQNDDGTWWVGGFDRTEMYQDPWTKAVFVSGHGDTNYVLGGKSVVNHAAVIFRSNDRGSTWSLFEEHSEWGRQPYVLGSTPNWPLLVLMEVSSEPYLFALKKGGSSLDGGHSVVAVSGGKQIPVGRDSGVADVGSNLGSPLCIARIGETDQVRIAYPSVDAGGRQGYEICNVTLAASGNHVVDHIARIEAIDPSKVSCTLGSFSRDDQVHAEDTAMMFSWIEAPPSSSPDKDKLLARGKVFFGTTGEYESKTLSLTSGASATFSRLAIGHYVTAAGFHHGGKAHFLAQWAVKDGIRGNIMSMPT